MTTQKTNNPQGSDRTASNDVNFCPICGHNQAGIYEANPSTGHVGLPQNAKIIKCGDCGHETVVIPQGEE